MGSFSDNSHVRFYVRATANSTTIQESFNVASVEDTATGRMTVNVATDFVGATWAPGMVIVEDQADANIIVGAIDNGTITAGVFVMDAWLVGATTEALNDPVSWSAWGFGNQ